MSMREKLGRGLSVAARCRPAFDDPRTTDDNGINIITGRELGLALADVALKILLKPTKGMIRAGWEDGMGGWGEGEEMEPVFKAMIKAAMKNK